MWNMTVAMNDTMKTVRVDLLKAEVDDLVSRILVDDFELFLVIMTCNMETS